MRVTVTTGSKELKKALFALLLTMAPAVVLAVGTPVGTVIQNTATVTFDLGGTPVTVDTNTTSVTVLERIEVNVTVQTPQVLVTAGDTNRSLLFTLTNTGNGSEAFVLAIDSVIAGDDFDPVPAVPAIYVDTDGSGDFNVGDVAYDNVTPPVLAADASLDVLLVNDIPGTALNGEAGRSELTATSATGSGAPGDEFTGQGDGGVDAIVGTSGGVATGLGEYLVSDVMINVVKAQAVADPFGGVEPVPGATITYTMTVEVVGTGTATASVLNDAIPIFCTYVPNSITLNAAPLSDAIDADAGEFDTSGAPSVVVRLGDLTVADGIQTVEFQVTID